MDEIFSENKFAIMPEWVINLDISHTAFRLYAVLARYADNVTHQAFPSLDTLSSRLGCSEKTVRRAIDDLVSHGAIRKHSRGRYQSSVYTVMTSPPEGTKMSNGGTKMSDEGTKMSTRLDMDDQVTITTELEPLELEPVKSVQTDFDQFWEIYPLKKDKPRSRRAFQSAMKRVSLDVILDGARRYRDDPNRVLKYTKNPTTWLNNDAWDNPPEPSREEPRKLSNAEKAARLALELEVRSVPLQVEQAPDVLEVETPSFDWIGRDPE